GIRDFHVTGVQTCALPIFAVGVLAAYGYSLVATFLPGLLPENARYVYYEAATVIVTLILFGRMLEARASGRASQAISKLAGLQELGRAACRERGWQRVGDR